ncbi:hypothetical protein TrVE_jg3977 [Triparma verrucosa]|uniref:Uncharacterized protein n=1 Tax=Triparma verrucosa TaxID=1606542 RepID=A0A9W7EQF3_9STRA|nr:hypothetical protein TrVE_jg3977 [Triparma verrucosa]
MNSLQKDVRTLTSSTDMIQKKRALINVSKLIFTASAEGPPSVSEATFQPYFVSDLFPALIKTTTDEKEKIRELSLNLLLKIVGCKEMEAFDFTDTLKLFSEDVFKRGFASASPKPFTEPAEEIRLLLLKTTTTLLNHPSIQPSANSKTTTSVFSTIIEGIIRACGDNFPEVKRECCLCLAKMSKKGGEVIKMHAESLTKQLNTNLNHQHSKTRQMTVKAIGIVLSSAGGVTTNSEKLMIETVLPSLKKTGFDQIPSVRKGFITCLVKILNVALDNFDFDEDPSSSSATEDKMVIDGEATLQENKNATSNSKVYAPFVPQLLAFLLGMCCDEVEEVKNVALEELQKLADSRKEESIFKFQKSPDDMTSKFISYYFEKILSILVTDAGHWTSGQREKALSTLTTLIEFTAPAHPSLYSNLEIIISCLASAINDDEEVVAANTSVCAGALGKKLGASPAAIQILLPRLDGSLSGMNTPEKLVGSLLILSSILVGSDDDCVVNLATKISTALSSPAILESTDRDVLEALLETAENFVDKVGGRWKTCEGSDGALTLNLLHSCIFLLGADVNYDLRDGTGGMLKKISGFCGCGDDVSMLFDGHFVNLVNRLRGEPELTVVWPNGKDPNLRAFDALMRVAGATGGKHFASVIDIFESHMNVDNEPESRLVVMALLESVLNNKQVAEYVKEFTGKLINDVVAPNIVWRAGGVASTIRKVSIACLFTILKSETVDTQTLFQAAPKLLPVLKTNLGDYDASSRQLCCLSLGIIFASLPGALGMEPVHQLYPDLLKCLDDSSDDVRFAACGTLKVFLKSAPAEHFKGTLMDYLCDQLLIHMDDPDPVIQQSVFDILLVAIEVDKDVVKKKATATRNSHRDVRLCDLLLKQC